MPITTLKQSVQVLFKVIRWLIFKKHDSIFSKRLTLPWGTAIVISWLNSSTSISGFIVLCWILNALSHWKWGEGGCLFCCLFLFLLISRYTHTLRWPLKWKDVIQVIDLTQMKQDLLIPHESITSSAPSNGRERRWWGVCSSVSVTGSSLGTRGLFCIASCNGGYHTGSNPWTTYMQEMNTQEKFVFYLLNPTTAKGNCFKDDPLFGGKSRNICVAVRQQEDWFNGAFHSVSIWKKRHVRKCMSPRINCEIYLKCIWEWLQSHFWDSYRWQLSGWNSISDMNSMTALCKTLWSSFKPALIQH